MAGHDSDSDVFVAAMLAPSREKPMHLPADYRSVLQRISLEMSKATNLIVETGWGMVGAGTAESTLAREIASALERGLRERERLDFFAILGHELRTPLTSIHGYLETLLEKQHDARMSRRFLQNAHREALRLGRLVDGMFRFSCLSSSTEGAGCEQCDLKFAVRTARDAVLPMAASRGVRIEVSNVVSRIVTMEGDACTQALINILDNAIKHGREQGTITISSNAGAGYVRIIIDDDGLGVPELERNAIFGLRVRGSSAQKPGTGLA
ncbi:MAG: HAMP domain-containing histidine kinase [Candidatus Eremiobacteraeota bacterium]|nr:HAMP domain-containing histidine kinase [Candidatus Eremiobacteraeota bacterium]